MAEVPGAAGAALNTPAMVRNNQIGDPKEAAQAILAAAAANTPVAWE